MKRMKGKKKKAEKRRDKRGYVKGKREKRKGMSRV